MSEIDYPTVVHLQRVSDGRVVQIDQDTWIEDGRPSVFMWEEGNYACDCNRHLYFERAEGREPDFDSTKCSDGKYKVVKITDKKSGEVIWGGEE